MHKPASPAPAPAARPAPAPSAGFDDIDVAAYVDPPLTTLRQPRAEMGARAMRLLLALLDGKTHRSASQPTILQGQLVIREST